jgi:hypothetical protein
MRAMARAWDADAAVAVEEGEAVEGEGAAAGEAGSPPARLLVPV